MIAVGAEYIYATNRSLLKLQLAQQSNDLLSAKLLNASQMLEVQKQISAKEKQRADNLELIQIERQNNWDAEKIQMEKENRAKNKRRFLLGSAVGAVAVLIVGLLI